MSRYHFATLAIATALLASCGGVDPGPCNIDDAGGDYSVSYVPTNSPGSITCGDRDDTVRDLRDPSPGCTAIYLSEASCTITSQWLCIAPDGSRTMEILTLATEPGGDILTGISDYSRQNQQGNITCSQAYETEWVRL